MSELSTVLYQISSVLCVFIVAILILTKNGEVKIAMTIGFCCFLWALAWRIIFTKIDLDLETQNRIVMIPVTGGFFIIFIMMAKLFFKQNNKGGK